MLEGILILVACAIFGVPVFMNTLGPFVIWKTQKLPAVVKFKPLDNDLFLAERSPVFVNYNDSIIGLGFEVVGSSMLEDSHSESTFRLYWNSELSLSAMAVTIKSNVEEMTYIEFTQKYNDGSVLDVSNSPRPEGYPDLGIKKAYRYPNLLCAVGLLAAHQKLSKNLKCRIAHKEFDMGSGFGEVESFLRCESDALLERGLVKPEIDENGKRSLTLLGALALTYRAVFPGKNIWGYITEMRAKLALKNA